MRKLLIFLIVLAVLVLATDRIALAVTQSVVADRMQASGNLDSKPSVHIRGFPFLTQAFSGRYDAIDVDAKDLHRNGVSLSSLDVRVVGARVALSDALGGKVDAVPVEALTAKAVVSYVELADDSKLVGATIKPLGDKVQIIGRVKVLGQSFMGKATSTIRLDGNQLIVKATSVDILGAHSSLIDRYVARLLDFTVRIDGLPYGLRLTGATAQPSGVVLDASSGPTVLRAP